MRCRCCGAKIKSDFCPYCLNTGVKYEEPVNVGKSVVCLFFGHVFAILTLAFAMLVEAGIEGSTILMIIGLIGMLVMGSLTLYLFTKSGISDRLCKIEGWIVMILGVLISIGGYFIGSGIIVLGLGMSLLGMGLIELGNMII